MLDFWDNLFDAVKPVETQEVQIQEEPRIPILQFSGTTGRSAKNNNPLNLEFRPGTYQDKYGAVLEPTGGGKDKRPRFAKFPDMMSGYNAAIDQIKLDQSPKRNHTLRTFVYKFAPPHENPSEEITRQYAKSLGVDPNTPLSQIDPHKLIVPMLVRESSTHIVGKGGGISPIGDRPINQSVSQSINQTVKDPQSFVASMFGSQPQVDTTSGLDEVLKVVGDFIGPSPAEAGETPSSFVGDMFGGQTSNLPQKDLPQSDTAQFVGETAPLVADQPMVGVQPTTEIQQDAGTPETSFINSMFGDLTPPSISGPSQSDVVDIESRLLDISGVSQGSPGLLDTLKMDVAGSPMYEWLATAGLLVGSLGTGFGVVGPLTVLKLARFLGPHAAKFLGAGIGSMIAGTLLESGRTGLEEMGVYHPWRSEEKPEGLWKLLEPSSYILDKPESEQSFPERLGAAAIDWGVFDAGWEAFKLLKGGKKAALQSFKTQAEKIFEERMGVPLSSYTKDASPWGNVPKWVRNQIEPYKPPLEKLGDATWRKYIGEPAWDLLSKAGDLKVPFSKKTFTETLQPAMERLRRNEPNLAKDIDIMKIGRSLTEEGMEFVARSMQGLNPLERWELQRGVMGRSRAFITSPKVNDVLKEFDSIMSTVSSKSVGELYTREFQRQYGRLVGQPLRQVESEIQQWMKAQGVRGQDPTSILSHHLKRFSQTPQGATVKEIRSHLDDMIGDPLVPDPIRRYGIQLYNLPADTPKNVRSASSAAMTRSVGAVLKKDSSAVSALPRDGFVLSKHNEFKAPGGAPLYVLKDVELEMDAIKSIHKYGGGLYQKWFLTPWKTNKVVLRPSAHFRNLFSNAMLNDVGGLPFTRLDMYNKALWSMKRNDPTFQKFHQLTAQSGRFATEEIKRFEGMARHGDNVLDNMYNLYETIAAPARSLYGAEETWFKYAKYLHNVERGMDPHEAAMDAIKWTFNYGEITPFTAAVRSNPFGIPFYTWMSKSIPLMLESQVKYPLRTGKWWAMLLGLSEAGMSNSGMTHDEFNAMWKDLPDYIQKGIWLPMPWRGDDGQLKILNMTWMMPGIGDMAELYGRGTDNVFSLLLQNPFMNLGGSLLNGRTELGIPIWYEWESPMTKGMKAISHIWKFWAPSNPMVPGSIDFNTLWDAFQGRPESLSPMEAVGSQFGFKLKTIDPRLVRMRREAVRKIHKGEANVMMNRELRNALDDREKEAIINRYIPLLQGIDIGDRE